MCRTLRAGPRCTLFAYAALFRSPARVHELALHQHGGVVRPDQLVDRKSTRLNSSHLVISNAAFCWKKKMPSIKNSPTPKTISTQCQRRTSHSAKEHNSEL